MSDCRHNEISTNILTKYPDTTTTAKDICIFSISWILVFGEKQELLLPESKMAGTHHSRKVASLIVLLAIWFLISECDVNWLKQILGSVLIPLLTPKNQIKSSTTELTTKTATSPDRGMMNLKLFVDFLNRFVRKQ